MALIPAAHAEFWAEAAMCTGCDELEVLGRKTVTPAVEVTVKVMGVLPTPPQLSHACTTVL